MANGGHRYKAGHPKYGGRKVGTPNLTPGRIEYLKAKAIEAERCRLKELRRRAINTIAPLVNSLITTKDLMNEEGTACILQGGTVLTIEVLRTLPFHLLSFLPIGDDIVYQKVWHIMRRYTLMYNKKGVRPRKSTVVVDFD